MIASTIIFKHYILQSNILKHSEFFNYIYIEVKLIVVNMKPFSH